MTPVRIAVHGDPRERLAWDEAVRMLNMALHDVAQAELFWAPTREAAIADTAPILCLSLLPDLSDPASWKEVEAAWDRHIVDIERSEPPDGRTTFLLTILRHLPAEHAHHMPRLRQLNLLAPMLSHRHGLLVIDLDRDLAHRGAEALKTDATLTGPAGQQAAGLLIANTLLSYGFDRFVPDAILDAAIKRQARVTAEGLFELKMPLKMKTVYINFREIEPSGVSVEDAFRRYVNPVWRPARFDAIDEEFVERNRIPGACSPVQKACFLSHKSVLKLHMDDSEHLLIMEDGVRLGKSAYPWIGQIVRDGVIDNWDVLFAVVTISDPDFMLDLLDTKEQLQKSNIVNIVDLMGIPFYSTATYIVNSRSKQKLFNLMDSERDISLPIDGLFSKFISEGIIKGGVIFPFLVCQEIRSIEARNGESAEARDLLDLSYSLSQVLGWADAVEDDWRVYVQKIDTLIGGNRSAIGIARTGIRVASKLQFFNNQPES